MLVTDNSLGLGNGLLGLGKDELDVAGVGHVGVDLFTVLVVIPFVLIRPYVSKIGKCTYATVGAVGAAALLGGLVDLNVLDNQVAGVETLSIGVGLGVLEETEKELGGLGGPAGTGNTPLLAYCQQMSAYEHSWLLSRCRVPDCFGRAGCDPREILLSSSCSSILSHLLSSSDALPNLSFQDQNNRDDPSSSSNQSYLGQYGR